MHPSHKLVAKHHGPFKITMVISPIVYQLEIPKQWKQCRLHDVFHASLLTRYEETMEHGVNFHEPPPEIIEGEPEYKVEKILASRQQGHSWKLHYLIKWIGYSNVHNTWEPHNQVHTPELIKEFYQENETAIRHGQMTKEEKEIKRTDPYNTISIPLSLVKNFLMVLSHLLATPAAMPAQCHQNNYPSATPSSAPRETRCQRERRIAANRAATEAATTRPHTPPPAHRPLRPTRASIATDLLESDEATPIAYNPMNMPHHGYPWETINNLTKLHHLYPVKWEHALSEMVAATNPNTE